jgi:Fe-S oxidoreductase
MSSRRALRVLDARRAELETCTYCPKLCRAACPVSNAEASDTVTPWGKMRGTHAVGRAVADVSPAYAALPWACTGCLACRERCDHRNPVRETLYEARAEFVRHGVAPEPSERVRRGFFQKLERAQSKAAELSRTHDLPENAATVLVLGCKYTLRFEPEASAAIRAVRALFGPVRLASGCCGAPLDAAGDPEAARALRERLARDLGGAARAIALDSGCAYTLRELSVEPLARAALPALSRKSREPPFGVEPLRYHDSCLLGRGLGEYDAPRAIVAQASERGALEFFYRREHARCSGGGGLLPLTRPENARAIRAARVAEHERLGGGTIVTACAESLASFRAAGAKALDLASVIARLAEP